MTAVTSRHVPVCHRTTSWQYAARALLCLLLLGTAAGCNSKSRDTKEADRKDSTSTETGSGNSTEEENSRCTDLVSSAVDMLQPDRLGITASSNTAVDLLNSWLRSCGGNQIDLSDYVTRAEPAILKAASVEGLAAVQSDRFSERDIRHVRDSLLMKQAGEAVIEGAESGVERVVRLFEFTCRTVALEPNDQSEVPLTPYHILLTGRGTSADRAWVFAALLRQLKIDSVILAPPAAAAEEGSAESGAAVAGGPWLMGVLHEGQVLVFSPQLGLPVPAAKGLTDRGTVAVPATLSQLRQEPGLVQELYAAESRKEAVSALVQQPRVLAISSSSLWSTRMGALQTTLSGDDALVVFDGLEDSALGIGLLGRVSAPEGSLWDADAVSVWGWPEQQQHLFDNITDDDRLYQRFLVREYPFRAPARVRADQERKQLAFDPSYTQLKTRIRQLQGDHASAIRTYLTVRLSERFNPQLPVPAEYVAMHAQAAEDAYFWMAVCQLEQKLHSTAIENLRLYMKKYPNGRWKDHSRILLSTALAAEGLGADAARQAELVSEDHPQRPGLLYLATNWRKGAPQAAETPEKGPAEPSPAPSKEPTPPAPEPEKPASGSKTETPSPAAKREPVVAPRPEIEPVPADGAAEPEEKPTSPAGAETSSP